MEAEPTPKSWWATLPGILTALAGIVTSVTALIVALNQAGVFHAPKQPSPQAHYGTTQPPETTKTPAATAAVPAATKSAPTGRTATPPGSLLIQDEVRAGPVAYKFLTAQLDPYSEGKRALRFAIRFTNIGVQWGVAIGPGFFRLAVDGVPLAPEKSFIGVIDFQSAKEGEVLFVVPETASSMVLQVGDVTGTETTKIPINLKTTGG